MKLIIDVEDFYLDEGSLEKNLKEFIIRQAVSEIYKKIEKKVDDAITEVIRTQVTQELKKIVEAEAAKLVETTKIKNGSEEVFLKDYITKRYQQAGWNSPFEKISELAKKFGDELKARYDLAFATQIINKLKQNDLLNDENVAKLLGTGD
jgi:hypothetical protein